MENDVAQRETTYSVRGRLVADLVHPVMRRATISQGVGKKIRNAGWALGVCVQFLAACSHQPGTLAVQEPDNSRMRVISGEVWYRERIALPSGARVIVTLEDQSRADAPATVITDYTYTVDSQQAPYPFRLVYDPAAIVDRMTYGLRARIEKDGELMFSSTEHIDPFADGSLRIMVTRQGRN